MRLIPVIAVALLLAACGDDKMVSQPKFTPYAPSNLFPDGASARPAPPGTVARGAHVAPPPLTMALLRRGRQRFDIDCAPCHGRTGDGDGIVVSRGFLAPPSYYSQRLRAAPDAHFLDVIAHGYGVMASYADRVSPYDRYAIVAYIRALQLSRAVPVAALTRSERQRLDSPSTHANQDPGATP